MTSTSFNVSSFSNQNCFFDEGSPAFLYADKLTQCQKSGNQIVSTVYLVANLVSSLLTLSGVPASEGAQTLVGPIAGALFHVLWGTINDIECRHLGLVESLFETPEKAALLGLNILAAFATDRYVPTRILASTLPLINLADHSKNQQRDDGLVFKKLEANEYQGNKTAIAKDYSSLNHFLASSKTSCNPLFHAMYSGHLHNIEALNQVGNFNPSPRDAKGNTPLHLSVLDFKLDILEAVLKLKGVQLDAVNDHYQTPLALAVLKKIPKAAQLLVDAGANVNFVMSDGKSLAEAAYLSNSIDVFNVLLTSPKLNLDILNTGSGLPLNEHIMRNGSQDWVDTLCNFYLSKSLSDPNFKIPKACSDYLDASRSAH